MAQLKTRIPDEELYTLFKSGDSRAGDMLFSSWTPRLIQFGLNRGCSLCDAQDITQETFRSILQTKTRFSGRNFTSWICHIAQNHIWQLWGKNQRTVEWGSLPCSKLAIDSGFLDPAKWLEVTESDPESLDVQQIKKVLKHLKPQDRAVIRMRLFEERSFEDIARKEGLCDKSAVFSRYKFALQRAREAFEVLRDPDSREVVVGVTLGDCKRHMSVLTSAEAFAVRAVYFRNRSVASASRAEEVSLPTMYNRLHRAIRKIKQNKPLCGPAT